MKCPKCGRENSDDKSFCVSCGTRLRAAASGTEEARFKGSLSAGMTQPSASSARKRSAEKSAPAASSGRLKGSLRASGNAEVLKDGSGASAFHPKSPWAEEEGKSPRRASSPDGGDAARRFCTRCGSALDADGGCPRCGRAAAPVAAAAGKSGSSAGPWIIGALTAAAVLLIIVISVSAEKSGAASSPVVTASVSAPAATASVSAPAATASVQATATPVSTPAATPKPVQTPTPTAAVKTGPGPDDMKGCDARIVEPRPAAWLAEYDVRYVQSTGGVSIYLRYGPSKQYDHFDVVMEAESVTVLAEQDGFALVFASGDRLGWCNAALIVPGNERIAPVPSLSETYWTYFQGQSLGVQYACLFHANGTYSAYSLGGGIYSEGSYSLTGRRLTLGSIKFVWDGEAFVSTEKYQMQVGWDFLRIYPDPTAYYEQIRADVEGRKASESALPDDVYYGELIYEEVRGGSEYITFELIELVGSSEYSDNPIFENTGRTYTLRVSESCMIRDSSVFDDWGLTEEYFVDVGPIIERYGFGVQLRIMVSGGEIVYIDKFYIA